jgi:hypothetical protein
MKPIVCLFLSGFIVASCGPVVKTSRLSDSAYQPKAENEPIKVYVENFPECPFEELAIVVASTGAFSGDLNSFVPAMKNEARKLGGDALLLKISIESATGYVEVSPGVVGSAKGDRQSATIIKFTEADCTN